MRNKVVILIALQFILAKGFAQQSQEEVYKHMMDSIKATYMDKLAFKNPAMRQLTFSSEYFGAGDVNSDFNDDPLFDGSFQTVRYFANLNVPLAQLGKNSFSASVSANRQHISLKGVETYNVFLPVNDMEFDQNLLSASLQFTRVDSLFKHPIVYTVNVSEVIDPETGQNRLFVGGLSLFTLRKTEKSTLSLIFVVTLDPTSPYPVIPFIMYDTKLNSNTELSLGLAGINLRKELNQKTTLSIFNNLGGNLLLFETSIPNIPSSYNYSSLELKSGLSIEYLLTKKMVLTARGGVLNTLSSKILEKGEAFNPLVKNNVNMVPYAQVGISFLPFWKGLAK